MKSLYRCTEQMQGDRCKLEKLHDGDHQGANLRWNVRGSVRLHDFTRRDRNASRYMTAMRKRAMVKK